MDWWIWVVISAATIMLAIDWMIVMGKDPRKWKGGDKDGK